MNRSQTRARPAVQPDECPYQRPFPTDFAECPAYLQTEYVGLNLQYQPLPPVWTCQNLIVAERLDRPGAHYARCRLGNMGDRLEWLRRVERESLTAAIEMRREFNREFQDLTIRLWTAKGRVLQAPDDQVAKLALSALAEEFKTACDAFFEKRAEVLSGAEIPLEPIKRLVHSLVDRLVKSRSAAPTLVISPEELADFPPSVHFFLQPEPTGPGEGHL